MATSHLISDPGGRSAPHLAALHPGRSLRTRGLTLLELDHESDALFVALHSCGPESRSARETFLEAKRLCRRVYAERYPDYTVELDEPYDANACLIYSRAGGVGISSMLRVCFDSEAGLPIAPSLEPEIETLRRCGVAFAEPGRFVIPDGPGLYKAYIRAIYQVACACEIELYLMQVRAEHADFYRRNCGAVELDSELAAPGCINLAWNLERMPRRFFRAFGPDHHHLHDFLAAQE